MILALVLAFVGYGEALAAFGTTTGQYVTAVSGFHAETETVLVNALALRRLIGAFHLMCSFKLGRQRYGLCLEKARLSATFTLWMFAGSSFSHF